MTEYIQKVSKRSAFLLNANARAVDETLVASLRKVIPAGDIFLSETLEEAEKYAHTILSRGYQRVFTGGGDGTIMSTISLLKKVQKKHGGKIPAVGILKLGTGNAMAVCIDAQNPIEDAFHIVEQGDLKPYKQFFIENEEGESFPFAGMGYDAQVVNDYTSFKNFFKDTWLHRIASSLFGYVLAATFITAPRLFFRAKPMVRIRSNHVAYRIIDNGVETIREEIAAGQIIYEGQAPLLAVGSIPYFGYGLKMFPFVKEEQALMQMRVSSMPILSIFKNLYPGLWKGQFRHPLLKDYLLKDVEMEFSDAVDYQVGGDARGQIQQVSLRIGKQPIQMLRLENRIYPPKSSKSSGLLANPAK